MLTLAERVSESHRNDQASQLVSDDTVVAPEANVINLSTMVGYDLNISR